MQAALFSCIYVTDSISMKSEYTMHTAELSVLNIIWISLGSLAKPLQKIYWCSSRLCVCDTYTGLNTGSHIGWGSWFPHPSSHWVALIHASKDRLAAHPHNAGRRQPRAIILHVQFTLKTNSAKQIKACSNK